MKYSEFSHRIREVLELRPAGLTWAQLRVAAALPYNRPCPEWVARLECDIGLVREKAKGRALIWKVSAEEPQSTH